MLLWPNSTNAQEKLELPNNYLLQFDQNSSKVYILDGPATREPLYLGFTFEGTKQITKIYKSYTSLIDIKLLLNKEIIELKYSISQLEKKTKSYNNSLDLCEKTLDSVESDRKTLNSVIKEERKDYKKDIRKQKIKSIFIITGSTVAGIGVGIIIGLLAI